MVKPIPDGYHTVTPYLVIPDPQAVIDFAKAAFDADVKHVMTMPDGTIMHAEIKVGDSPIMMGRSSEEWPPVPAMLYLYVEDVDAVFAKALAAGGERVREPTDEFYGDRSGGVRDCCGNFWWLGQHIEDVSDEDIQKRMQTMRG